MYIYYEHSSYSIRKFGICIGSEMSSDDRSWLMQTVLGMDIASTVSYFYPRLIPVVSICVGLTRESISIRSGQGNQSVYLKNSGKISRILRSYYLAVSQGWIWCSFVWVGGSRPVTSNGVGFKHQHERY